MEEDVENGGGWEMSRLGDEVVATDLVSPPIGGEFRSGLQSQDILFWPSLNCGQLQAVDLGLVCYCDCSRCQLPVASCQLPVGLLLFSLISRTDRYMYV